MELGQVLNESQRKERFSHSLQQKRAHRQVLSWEINFSFFILCPLLDVRGKKIALCRVGHIKFLAEGSKTGDSLPSGRSTPSVLIILPLFETMRPHLSNPNDIPMSLLWILVVWISEFISRSFLAYSLMSSM